MNKVEFLKQFDNKEDLAEFDFKKMIDDSNYNYEIEHNVENFLNYRFLEKYDCDKIFGNIFEIKWTDTLNSFWTIFKKYIQTNLHDEFDLENEEIKKEYIDKYKKQYTSDLSSKQLWCIHLCNMIKENNIVIDQGFVDFAELNHTIGNFMAVPKGFNVNRYTNTFDYMDLTLLCIYKWYITDSDFWLEILLNNNKEAIKNTKEWLSSYTYWLDFVVANGLVSYVNDENDDYRPKEFFNNHFNNFETLINNEQSLANYNEKEKLLNPQTKSELLTCVENINDFIWKRGVYMAEKELKDINTESEENKNINHDFHNVIITNKKDVTFPVVADILTLAQFYELATSEEGIGITGSCYVDIDLLNDKELYDGFKENLGEKIIFFRANCSWMTDEVLEWDI